MPAWLALHVYNEPACNLLMVPTSFGHAAGITRGAPARDVWVWHSMYSTASQ